MEGTSELSAHQTELLQRVAAGEFSNAASIPADLATLVADGYVQATPTVLFPVMPSRHDYRLTWRGEQWLQRHADHS